MSPCISFADDSFPEGSIDLKCKERVTDSDEENDPADETDGKVKFERKINYGFLQCKTVHFCLGHCKLLGPLFILLTP